MIRIRMNGLGAEQELLSLYAWLQDEPAVRSHAGISLPPQQKQPGEMGGAFDVIQLSVDSAFQALSLALAYAAWRDTRRDHPDVTVERGDIKITLVGIDKNAAEEIVRALEQDSL